MATTLMARSGAYLAAFLLLAGTLCAQGAPTIPADTRLIVRVAATVTSRTAQVGDIVETILVEHRPPTSGRDAGRAFLEPGTRVAGVVEHVRRAERGRVAW